MSRTLELEKRFYRNGLSSFDQTEILEFLLSLRVDKSGHRRMANKLIQKYNNINNVIDEHDYNLSNISNFNKKYLVGLKLPHYVSNIYLYHKTKESPVLSSPGAVYTYLQYSLRGLNRECFKVLYLNSQNRIICSEDISIGTIDQTPVYPREIIKSAIQYNAVSIIASHNHPSGSLIPSKEDIQMTKNLKQAVELFNMSLLDHILIAGDDFLSFAHEGLLE